jgi:predicted DCC family thiol-disulfide oxidoreductase YuxK
MNPVQQVNAPPARPLMVFDGDCGFCRLWIRRWNHYTEDRVDYRAYQDPVVAEQFPEIPAEQFSSAVQFIEPDGRVSSGAAAVFAALAAHPRHQWLLEWYIHSAGFARATEWGYRLVARHRSFFSWLTRMGWGRTVEPPSQLLVRWIFLRAVGVVYLVAFVSLWMQIMGLVGSSGIIPAGATMESIRTQADAYKLGLDRYHIFPTFCWYSASDSFLKFQCAAGAGLALLVIFGVAPAPCLFLLWLIYLSLSTVCREFLGFQWDILLLQVGFLSIFFAPLQFLARIGREAPPSRIVLWVLRWLLFQLMLESGLVKLLSRDPSWHHLTALNFHYETQPLPTWIAWYAHQLSAWFQAGCVVAMFVVELLVPFLIFAPRRIRHFGCGALVLLQVGIMATGNYCFFNLLVIVLCLSLLDDFFLLSLLPAAPRQRIESRLAGAAGESAAAAPGGGAKRAPRKRWKWPVQVTVPLAIVAIGVSLLQMSAMAGLTMGWPGPVIALYQWLAPLRTFNHYGLFAVMTTSRPEIVVEGSNDGVTWREYEFKYKPGDVRRRPRFVEPHQPRLDWQMWFAALGTYPRNPWFVNFCTRLLQGSPEVLALMDRDPFPGAPPRYVRALLYDYHFTDPATRRRTGAWWRRELKGEYLPPISLGKDKTLAGGR